MPAKKPVAKKPIKAHQPAVKKSLKAATKKPPAKKTSVKRATAAKAVVKKTPKQSTSTAVAVVKPVTLSSQSEARGAEWELVESKQHELVRDWAKRLNQSLGKRLDHCRCYAICLPERRRRSCFPLCLRPSRQNGLFPSHLNPH